MAVLAAPLRLICTFFLNNQESQLQEGALGALRAALPPPLLVWWGRESPSSSLVHSLQGQGTCHDGIGEGLGRMDREAGAQEMVMRGGLALSRGAWHVHNDIICSKSSTGPPVSEGLSGRRGPSGPGGSA